MTPLKRLSLDLGFLFSKLQLNELRLKPLIIYFIQTSPRHLLFEWL